MSEVPEQFGAISHEAGRPQSWRDCNSDIHEWIDRITRRTREAQGENLVGVYLHGSLAMGSYYRPKSDVDLLIVVREPLSPEQRRDVARVLLQEHDARPITGGLEVSVLTQEHARTYVHPSPYEVHFSEMWAEAVRRGSIDWAKDNADPELAVNLTTARERGVSLFGPPPTEVFGEVPFANYVAGIHCDFDWIVDNENILTTPFYGVLNACRGLMVFRTGKGCVPSKEEAAHWAIPELPAEHHPIIEQALACYRSSSQVAEQDRRVHGHAWDRERLLAFARDIGGRARGAEYYGVSDQ